jgi:hypothetical protein
MTKRILLAFTKNRLISDLRPNDFEQLRATWVSWGPVMIAGEVQRVRSRLQKELSCFEIRNYPNLTESRLLRDKRELTSRPESLRLMSST